MAFYSSSIVTENVATNLSQYDLGLQFYRQSDGSMSRTEGDYCTGYADVVRYTITPFEEHKFFEVIDVYLDAAYSNLPKDEEKLRRMYELAMEIKRLAKNTSYQTNYAILYNEIAIQFEQLLKESDADFPGTCIDIDSKQKEALNFAKILGNI